MPSEDAPIVEALKAAGGIMVGKTDDAGIRLFELHREPALGHHPQSVEPGANFRRFVRRIGAAVASGCVPMAEGSDMGGSVRIPPAFAALPG